MIQHLVDELQYDPRRSAAIGSFHRSNASIRSASLSQSFQIAKDIRTKAELAALGYR